MSPAAPAETPGAGTPRREAAPGAPAPGAGLEAVALTRTFGTQRAVNGVDFHLPAGAFLSLFGPNGAGKSTLLRILAGGLRPTSGELRLDGEPLKTRAPAWQRRVGVLSHQSFLYGHLTARENLRFFADLYDLDDVSGRIRRGLESVDLLDRADDEVRGYSRGMRQRLALARTLLHEPDVVLLDEPFTGLDAHASAVLREVLTTLRDGRRTVVMVTHNLTEGLTLADVAAIQVRGRIAFWEETAGLSPQTFPGIYRSAVETAS